MKGPLYKCLYILLKNIYEAKEDSQVELSTRIFYDLYKAFASVDIIQLVI